MSISGVCNPWSHSYYVRSSYLRVGLSWYNLRRASAHDFESMGASTAGMIQSRYRSSIVNGTRQLCVVSFIVTYHVTFSEMVILRKLKRTRAVWARCSAPACAGVYILRPVGTVARHWLIVRTQLLWPSCEIDGCAFDGGLQLNLDRLGRCAAQRLGRLRGACLSRMHPGGLCHLTVESIVETVITPCDVHCSNPDQDSNWLLIDIVTRETYASVDIAWSCSVSLLLDLCVIWHPSSLDFVGLRRRFSLGLLCLIHPYAMSFRTSVGLFSLSLTFGLWPWILPDGLLIFRMLGAYDNSSGTLIPALRVPVDFSVVKCTPVQHSSTSGKDIPLFNGRGSADDISLLTGVVDGAFFNLNGVTSDSNCQYRVRNGHWYLSPSLIGMRWQAWLRSCQASMRSEGDGFVDSSVVHTLRRSPEFLLFLKVRYPVICSHPCPNTPLDRTALPYETPLDAMKAALR